MTDRPPPDPLRGPARHGYELLTFDADELRVLDQALEWYASAHPAEPDHAAWVRLLARVHLARIRVRRSP